MTEDKVRDKAGQILGFSDTPDAQSGVGQITSFNSLGFSGVKDRPDGWYLPNNVYTPAIILEAKSSETVFKKSHIDELLKNCKIVKKKYKYVVGILYNGEDVLVFKNGLQLEGETILQNKEYYLGLFAQNRIDKGLIYLLTKRINDCLHFDFGIKNLYHRMIFTACALVAKRYGAPLVEGMNYQTFHTSIHSTLAKSLEEERQQNQKIDLLLEVYSEIKMNSTENQEAIDNFINWVSQISDNINSDFWNGEDVMGIFFNEFNRYKRKSEKGQVFTPDHITSLMYRLIDVDYKDKVGDFACGSGAFLVKSMCNMIKEAGGVNTAKASEIKRHQLFGIEFDREIFALACANMLIHKDGKTNLRQLDTREEAAKIWIHSLGISKVLMNPPFEEKYGCMKIVANILESVPEGTLCAFILPDKKLEKHGGRKLLKKHTLDKIIKLPEKTFNEGVTTSIFIFIAGKPQKDKSIFACYIAEDGLETVKNQGRQDVRNRWQGIEDRWVEIIRRQSGDDSIQWLDASEHLSYQMTRPPFELYEEDFFSVLLDYELFKSGISPKEFKEALADMVLYYSSSYSSNEGVALYISYRSNHEERISDLKEKVSSDLLNKLAASKFTNNRSIDFSSWGEFPISSLFRVEKGTRLTKADMREGNIPFVGASAMNNGITSYISNNTFLHPENTITVSYNGSVGQAFYQEKPFWASDDINVLYPRFHLTRNIAMFLIPIIKQKGKSYEFIDKWKKEFMEKDTLLIPILPNGEPNFRYMENFISNLISRTESHLHNLISI